MVAPFACRNQILQTRTLALHVNPWIISVTSVAEAGRSILSDRVISETPSLSGRANHHTPAIANTRANVNPPGTHMSTAPGLLVNRVELCCKGYRRDQHGHESFARVSLAHAACDVFQTPTICDP
jgi:hypothetical protein